MSSTYAFLSTGPIGAVIAAIFYISTYLAFLKLLKYPRNWQQPSVFPNQMDTRSWHTTENFEGTCHVQLGEVRKYNDSDIKWLYRHAGVLFSNTLIPSL